MAWRLRVQGSGIVWARPKLRIWQLHPLSELLDRDQLLWIDLHWALFQHRLSETIDGFLHNQLLCAFGLDHLINRLISSLKARRLLRHCGRLGTCLAWSIRLLIQAILNADQDRISRTLLLPIVLKATSPHRCLTNFILRVPTSHDLYHLFAHRAKCLRVSDLEVVLSGHPRRLFIRSHLRKWLALFKHLVIHLCLHQACPPLHSTSLHCIA